MSTRSMPGKGMAVCRRWTTLALLSLLLFTQKVTGQESGPSSPLKFITRLTATGFSASSTPAGYKAYSSLHLDASLRWSFTPILAAEINFAHESREVDYLGLEEEISLGSMETLPLNILLQYHHPIKSWAPYIGAGLNYTLFWEKSGELNRKKLAPSVGPELQLGVDFSISPHAVLNLDIKFVRMITDFEGPNKEKVELFLHPSVMGIGLGFQF